MSLPLVFLDRSGASPQLEQLLARIHETDKRPPWLLCRSCGQRITDNEARIPIGDRHEHTVTNPHGFTFHIGCFDSAPGVVEEGEPSSYFSWFAGYHWRIVICQGCRWHLGWRFDDADSHFYGLILDRPKLEQPS